MSVEPVGAVFPGTTLTYTINYSNTGPATAHNVVISDVLPSMLLSPTVTFSGASITPQSGSRFIWDIADLEAGSRGAITITAQISSTYSGVIVNNASISTSSQEKVTSNNLTGPILTNVNLPTSVILNSFTADSWLHTILVEWETITDVIGLQGFNLYRSESFYGDRTQLNGALINPKPTGTDPFIQYQHFDRPITPDQTYYYWLEIVMDAGAETHGPSTVTAFYTFILLIAYP
jgi:uncharacterized repeat protein (TIGR01451 family)